MCLPAMDHPEQTEHMEPIEVFADISGERLDVFLSRITGETRSLMKKRLDAGDVLLNSKPAKANSRLKAGDRIELFIQPPRATELCPENIPLDIVYEDADIAVIDKPKGMVVHPAPGNPSGTLVNAIMFHIKDLSGIGGELRPGIVHRIDKMTSGLLVVAKNDFSHNVLSKQIKEHTAKRTYIAIVEGNIKEDRGTLNAPIGRHHTNRKKMAVVNDGREAVTHWSVLRRFGDFTLIRVQLETGRTHQIRVHMAYIKHPVAGDIIYGPDKPKLGLDGQALHAVELELIHPRTGETMRFFSPVPKYFLSALARIGCRDFEWPED